MCLRSFIDVLGTMAFRTLYKKSPVFWSNMANGCFYKGFLPLIILNSFWLFLKKRKGCRDLCYETLKPQPCVPTIPVFLIDLQIELPRERAGHGIFLTLTMRHPKLFSQKSSSKRNVIDSWDLVGNIVLWIVPSLIGILIVIVLAMSGTLSTLIPTSFNLRMRSIEQWIGKRVPVLRKIGLPNTIAKVRPKMERGHIRYEDNDTSLVFRPGLPHLRPRSAGTAGRGQHLRPDRVGLPKGPGRGQGIGHGNGREQALDRKDTAQT